MREPWCSLSAWHRFHATVADWIHQESGPSWWRAAAGCLSRLYGTGVAVKRRSAMKNRVKPPVAVVSVGNLTVGGTGKTPLVEWLVEHYQQKGLKTAVVMRGYGRRDDRGYNDEARLLETHFPSLDILCGSNRLDIIRRALDSGRAFDVVLLDDGFQQWSFQHDWEIVVVAAPALWLSGRLLPAGPFREPWTALERAHTVVVTHMDQTTMTRQDIERRLKNWTDATVVCNRHALTGLKVLNGETTGVGWEALQKIPCAVITGIGRPQAFINALESKKVRIARVYRFPDHHGFTVDELERIQHTLSREGIRNVLVTEKDAVKLIGRLPDQNQTVFSCVTMRLAWDRADDEQIMRRTADAVVAA